MQVDVALCFPSSTSSYLSHVVIILEIFAGLRLAGEMINIDA